MRFILYLTDFHLISIGKMTGSMTVLCVGFYGGASAETRERLFCNKCSMELKDDSGKTLSCHPDWDEDTYTEIIESFSEKDDFIFFPEIASGKE